MLKILRERFQKTVPTKHAMVYAVPGFVMIVAASGNLRLRFDAEAFQCTLPMASDPELLGGAVRDALAASRAIPIAKLQAFLDAPGDFGYEACVKALWRLVGGRPRAAVPENTARCDVHTENGGIVFLPMQKRHGSVWANHGEIEPVMVDARGELGLIGEALIDALRRCIPNVIDDAQP
ncbi:contact-dependent growth inhibition system immunity protein [Noviherbaspirillum massiliense]|uniref:contact-dependent growth inhibition system immunity protein n=1 Tax=Noviherbaspirillum massiliense TaxID=1465823 RepID=UPI001375DBDD|nr:contact-dependent growth inhibition system immunity protein [Noviherbaspirillum massiliense]